MSSTSLSLRPDSAARISMDLVDAAAGLAASATRSALAVVYLTSRTRAHWAPAGDGRHLPDDDGLVATRLLPAIAARPNAVRRVTRLADHPVAAGLTFTDLEGLASLATATIRDDSGARLGVVAAFDDLPRDWSDSDLAQLDAVAALVAQRGVSRAGSRAGRELADVALSATEALELSMGSDGVHALVEHASRSDDPVLRRTAGTARTALDRAAELRSRARSALRAAGSGDFAPTPFDIVTLSHAAVVEASGTDGGSPLGVSSSEPSIVVVGDVDRARAAVRRSVAAALTLAPANEVSVHVARLDSLPGRRGDLALAGVTVDVRGAELRVGDLARLAAGQFGRSATAVSPEASVRVSITAGETRLVAPGFDATSTPHGTWLTLFWPVEAATEHIGATAW